MTKVDVPSLMGGSGGLGNIPLPPPQPKRATERAKMANAVQLRMAVIAPLLLRLTPLLHSFLLPFV